MSERLFFPYLFLVAISMVFALTTSVRAQVPASDELASEEVVWHPELMNRIASYESARAEVLLPLSELREAYLAQLEKVKEVCQERGNLDQVLMVEKEISAINGGEPNDSTEGFLELNKARETYETLSNRQRDELEIKLDRIKDTFLRSLEGYQSDLTRKKEMEYAIEVKRYVESFREVEEAPEKVFIEVFWLPNFEGPSVALEVPIEIPSFNDDPRMRNDALASIRIPEGVIVSLSSTAKLGGKLTRFDEDEKNIPRGTSSLRARMK